MTNTILIADDSTLARRAILRELRAVSQTRVVEACDGHEALAHIRSERPQLVFLDVVMPGLTGLEVLEALAALPEKLPARVVVITSEEDPAVRDRARALGAWVVLPKPWPAGDVARLVRDAGIAEDPPEG
jgi:CheY-like chemotaxis protein